MSPRTVPLAAAMTFLLGFAVADVTGIRALGGLVLLAGGYLCARAALPVVGRGPTAVLLGAALVLFVVSHLLGHAIGAWPAVLVTAGLVALVAIAVLAPADRPAV